MKGLKYHEDQKFRRIYVFRSGFNILIGSDEAITKDHTVPPLYIDQHRDNLKSASDSG